MPRDYKGDNYIINADIRLDNIYEDDWINENQTKQMVRRRLIQPGYIMCFGKNELETTVENT